MSDPVIDAVIKSVTEFSCRVVFEQGDGQSVEVSGPPSACPFTIYIPDDTQFNVMIGESMWYEVMADERDPDRAGEAGYIAMCAMTGSVREELWIRDGRIVRSRVRLAEGDSGLNWSHGLGAGGKPDRVVPYVPYPKGKAILVGRADSSEGQ